MKKSLFYVMLGSVLTLGVMEMKKDNMKKINKTVSKFMNKIN